MSKTLTNLLLSVAVLAVGLAAGWFLWGRGGGSSVTIIDEIRKIAELHTIEYHGANILRKSKKDWAGASADVVYLTRGWVSAGVDLKEMEIELDSAGRRVVMTLPKARVLGARLPIEMETVCSSTHGIFPPAITDQERDQWRRDGQDSLVADARKANIEKIALDEAKQYLGALVQAFGYTAEFQ